MTSLLFHGTHHPMARFIDIHYAHLLGIKYLIHSVHNVIAYKRKKDFALHLGTLASLYIYTSKHLPHTVFHVSVQYLFTVHALDYVWKHFIHLLQWNRSTPLPPP